MIQYWKEEADMNGKRWVALAIAAELFLMSVIINITSTTATTNWDELFGGDEMLFEETVVDKGSRTGSGKIAVLNLEGVIQDTGSGSMFTTTGYNHQHFLKMIDEAGEDRSVDGIILRVNYPGGGVVVSAEIHKNIIDVQEETGKPVYVSMGNTAALGGYYVADLADKIVANPATLTGSIGRSEERRVGKECRCRAS